MCAQLLESRFCQPMGPMCSESAQFLDTPALHVVGCDSHCPQHDVRWQQVLAPKGRHPIPIAVRTLWLPGFYENWCQNSGSLKGLELVHAAILTSTTFQALVQRAWKSYGRKAAWHSLVFQVLDLIAFFLLAVLATEASAATGTEDRREQRPQETSHVVVMVVSNLMLVQPLVPLYVSIPSLSRRLRESLAGVNVERPPSPFVGRGRPRPTLRPSTRSTSTKVPEGTAAMKFIKVHECCLCCLHGLLGNLQVAFRLLLHCWARELDGVECLVAAARTTAAALVVTGLWHAWRLVPSLGLQSLQWEMKACFRLGREAMSKMCGTF